MRYLHRINALGLRSHLGWHLLLCLFDMQKVEWLKTGVDDSAEFVPRNIKIQKGTFQMRIKANNVEVAMFLAVRYFVGLNIRYGDEAMKIDFVKAELWKDGWYLLIITFLPV